MMMEEHQGQCHLCRVETHTWFIKLTSTLYLEHEITSVDILHNKKETILIYQTTEHVITTLALQNYI